MYTGLPVRSKLFWRRCPRRGLKGLADMWIRSREGRKQASLPPWTVLMPRWLVSSVPSAQLVDSWSGLLTIKLLSNKFDVC